MPFDTPTAVAAPGRATACAALRLRQYQHRSDRRRRGPAACLHRPQGDHDGDGIPNGLEGCASNRDSDGDKTPDWLDTDSDGDGIADYIEAGRKNATGKCAGAKPGGEDLALRQRR